MNIRQLVSALIFILSASFYSNASILTWDINCEMDSALEDCVNNGYVWGTITLDDDADGVDAGQIKVTIDLAGDSAMRAHKIYLNFSGTFADGDYFESNEYGVTYDADSVGSPNFFAVFDLEIPGNGNLGAADPLMFTLGLYDIDEEMVALTIDDFDDLNSLGLFAEVHIGACEGIFSCVDSIKVGAGEGDDGGGGQSIPEPQTLLILASAIFGIFFSRRRVNARS